MEELDRELHLAKDACLRLKSQVFSSVQTRTGKFKFIQHEIALNIFVCKASIAITTLLCNNRLNLYGFQSIDERGFLLLFFIFFVIPLPRQTERDIEKLYQN